MSEVEKLFKKIESMPLPELMNLCASAIENKMNQKVLEGILLMLETKLQKRRISIQLGIKDL